MAWLMLCNDIALVLLVVHVCPNMSTFAHTKLAGAGTSFEITPVQLAETVLFLCIHMPAKKEWVERHCLLQPLAGWNDM